MQRLLAIPLLTLYLLASIGVHGVSHFCGDVLVNTAFCEVNDAVNCVDDKDCSDNHSCCNQFENNTECCSDVNFNVFFESETVAANISKNSLVKIPEVPVFSSFQLNTADNVIVKWVASDVGIPDPTSPTPLYIKHHSLIFYG